MLWGGVISRHKPLKPWTSPQCPLATANRPHLSNVTALSPPCASLSHYLPVCLMRPDRCSSQSPRWKVLAWGPKYQQALWTTEALEGCNFCKAATIRPGEVRGDRTWSPNTWHERGSDGRAHLCVCVVWLKIQGVDSAGMSSHTLSLVEPPHRKGRLVTKGVCVRESVVSVWL